MKNQLFLSIAASLLSFQNAEAQVSYRYDSVKVTSSYKFENPAPVSKEAYVRIVYPIFQNNDLNSVVKNAVLSSTEVKYHFKNKLNTQHPALSNMDAINYAAANIQDFGDNFLKHFEAQAPQEDLKAYWYAAIKVKLVANKPDYIAIQCTKDFFTGGFHDIYETSYLNYDVRNQRIFTLGSQLKPSHLSQLTNIAERIFRKNEGLTPAEDLDGYFFKNGKFDLPANFTITDKGLLFFYDYYEIKPFAAGTTQLVVPFADLKELVLPNSILANQMRRQ